MKDVNEISNLCNKIQSLEIRLKETKVELELLRNTVLESQAINVKIGDIVFVRNYVTAYSGNKKFRKIGVQAEVIRFTKTNKFVVLSYDRKDIHPSLKGEGEVRRIRENLSKAK